MLRRLWQQFKRFFESLLRNSPQSSRRRRVRQTYSPSRGTEGTQPLPRLTDTDYEFLFSQLLEGVQHGWQQPRVMKFLADLKPRATEAEWVAWLQRFGERLLQAPTPNKELATRMLQLGELGCGEISDVSYELGRRLLMQGVEPIVEYAGPDAEPMTPEIPPEAEGFETVTLDELLDRLQEEPNLAALIAEQLGLETTDPQVIIQNLLTQFQAANVASLDEAEVWFEQGIEQFNAGDLEAAIASWDRSLNVNPNKPEAWHNRGVALSRLGRSEEADLSFEKAKQIRGVE